MNDDATTVAESPAQTPEPPQAPALDLNNSGNTLTPLNIQPDYGRHNDSAKRPVREAIQNWRDEILRGPQPGDKYPRDAYGPPRLERKVNPDAKTASYHFYRERLPSASSSLPQIFNAGSLSVAFGKENVCGRANLDWEIAAVNHDTNFDMKRLWAFGSTKPGGASMLAGQNGEGIKLAALNCLRYRWRLMYFIDQAGSELVEGTDETGKPVCLARTGFVETRPVLGGDSRSLLVHLVGGARPLVPDSEKPFDEEDFLFLLDPSHRILRDSVLFANGSRLLPNASKRFYSKDYFVQTYNDARIGVSFCTSKIDRDRGFFKNLLELYGELVDMWVGAIDRPNQALSAQSARQLMEAFSESPTPSLESAAFRRIFFTQALTPARANLARSVLAEFRSKAKDPKSMPVCSQPEKRRMALLTAWALGLRPLPASLEVAQFAIAILEKDAIDASKRMALCQLSTDLNDKAIAECASSYLGVSSKITIRICESDAPGLCAVFGRTEAVTIYLSHALFTPRPLSTEATCKLASIIAVAADLPTERVPQFTAHLIGGHNAPVNPPGIKEEVSEQRLEVGSPRAGDAPKPPPAAAAPAAPQRPPQVFARSGGGNNQFAIFSPSETPRSEALSNFGRLLAAYEDEDYVVHAIRKPQGTTYKEQARGWHGIASVFANKVADGEETLTIKRKRRKKDER